MFSKSVLFVGGLLSAVLVIGAADSFLVRQEIVNTDFADAVVSDVLDDPAAREPLVDELTTNWIAANPVSYSLMDARLPDADAELRSAIDQVLSGPDIRSQLSVALLELAPSQDELGVETITLDMSAALAAARADMPPEVASTLAAETDIVFSRDLSQVSRIRSILQTAAIAGAIGAAGCLAIMLGASRSPRRTNRALVAFGLPLAVLQRPMLDELVARAPQFTGEDVYSPLIAPRIAGGLEPPITAIVLVFGFLLLIELAAFAATRTWKVAEPVEENVLPLVRPVEQPSAGITWVETDRAVDRLAG